MIFSRLKYMIRKEFIQTFRDNRIKPIIFLVPVIQLIVFGLAVNTDVRNISTAVLDFDKTYESREVVRRIEASGYFNINYHPSSEKELRDLLDSGKAFCLIQMNNGFSEDIKRGRQGKIQAIFDGTDSNSATIAMGYINQIMMKYSKDLIGERMGKIGASLKIIEPQTRAWYNPELKSRNFFVPGVTAVLIMITCLILTSMAVVREREVGTIEQLMVTPLRPSELILGKTIPFALVGFFDMLLVTFFALMVFKIPLEGSIWLLVLATGAYLLPILGIGLFISTITKSQQQAMMATFLFFSPAMLLSGFIFPIENMPISIQYATLLNPLRYFLVIIRGIFLRGNGFDVLKMNYLALFVLGTSVIALSSLRFQKRLA